jgi:hypothetical protein
MAKLITKYDITYATLEMVKDIIKNSPEGRNAVFLRSSHAFWKQIENYKRFPPMSLVVDGEIVAMIFATFNKDRYCNLYEIVTMEGKEGNGYATVIWDEFMNYAHVDMKAERLKMSCTPSSITWHCRNGLIYWAVDRTGSLRSDQPLLPTRAQQFEFQKEAIANPTSAIPPSARVCERLRKEDIDSHGFGVLKRTRAEEAISAVGEAWLRSALFAETGLESILV